MKFTHLVKHNGVYYPAGADVPIEETNGGGNEAPAVDVSGKVEAKEEIPTVSVDDGRKYSEEDLKVGFMKLKSMAKKEGINVPPEWKSNDLKEALRKL